MEMRDLRSGKTLSPLTTVTSLGRETVLSLMQEDVLGHCYER